MLKSSYLYFATVLILTLGCSSKKGAIEPPTGGGNTPPNPGANTSYIAAPIKDANYDNNLNELYINWNNADDKWDKKNEYIGTEFEFYTLLSSKKVQRRFVPNTAFFGQLTVKKRDFNNEPSTLRLSKYRSVIVTPRIALDEIRYRTLYKNEKGEEQKSQWVLLKDQGKAVNKTYVASTYFMQNVTNPVQISFTSESSKPTKAIADLVGAGNEERAKEEFKRWYYMQVSAMSFDPFNLAFDPYSKLDILIKDGVGVANAIDYPNHAIGRRINYEASVNNPNSALWRMPDMYNVMLHEMGHCIQWMPRDGKYKKSYSTSSGTSIENCDRQGYQEGWPDAVKIANKGYDLTTQVGEYKTAMAYAYEDPTANKKFVWQIDYNTSGAWCSCCKFVRC